MIINVWTFLPGWLYISHVSFFEFTFVHMKNVRESGNFSQPWIALIRNNLKVRFLTHFNCLIFNMTLNSQETVEVYRSKQREIWFSLRFFTHLKNDECLNETENNAQEIQEIQTVGSNRSRVQKHPKSMFVIFVEKSFLPVVYKHRR